MRPRTTDARPARPTAGERPGPSLEGAPGGRPTAATARDPLTDVAMYRALTESFADQAIVAVDRAGRVVAWNAGAERLTGYAPAEAVGLSIDRLDALDAPARANARRTRALASTTGRAEHEGWRARKDGSRYWAHAVITPLRNAGGEPSGLAVVIRDETDRRVGADVLAESRVLFADRERYLQAVLDTQPECVTVVSPNGALLDVNAAGLALFEVDELAEVRGTPARDRVRPGCRDAFDARHAAALGGEPGTLECELAGLRGGRPWVEARAVPLRDGRGGVVAVLWVTRDVTVPRAAEALRQSEELFHGVVSLASDAIITVDEHQRVVLFNQSAEDAFGYAAAEVLGRPLDGLLPAGVLAHRTAERREVVGRRRGGEEFPAEVALSRSTVDGAVRHTAIVRDVSTERRLAAALQAGADELARSNAELEQFASVASHDLQEPLRMVSSYTQLLAKRYQGQLDARADTYIRYAVDGARRMQVLIDDLLALSRVGKGGHPPVSVDVGAVVDRAVATLADAVHASRARIHVDVLPPVLGDAGQLEQLFQNLIGNALKFGRPGRPPEISVTAGGPHADAHMATYAVHDRGIGLEMRHAEQIFVMFQRLHTREAYPGTGIGLAICRKIVQRHGGRIWVESEVGQGTTCYFTLPRAS